MNWIPKLTVVAVIMTASFLTTPVFADDWNLIPSTNASPANNPALNDDLLAAIIAAQNGYSQSMRSIQTDATQKITLTDYFYQWAAALVPGSNETVEKERARYPSEESREVEYAISGTKFYFHNLKEPAPSAAKPSNGTGNATGFFDGKLLTVYYDYTDPHTTAVNRTGYRQRSDPGEMIRVQSPLTFGYQLYDTPHEHKWIADILNNGNPTVVRAGVDPILGKVILVEAHGPGPHQKPMDYHIWFASKYGYAAIKCEEQGVETHTIDEAGTFARVGNYWIATSGHHTAYLSAKGRSDIAQIGDITYSGTKLNDIPDSTFTAPLEPSATIYDHVGKQMIVTDSSAHVVSDVPLQPGVKEPVQL